ncbi:hypothetical protein BJ508DRAFT_416581 [Ascobolus immersus RN42]|uniref:Uncharacterized protein n=1 Tax=Ascobolus immersus RN42 TaxID=1160509 RepID=A0A3N4HXH4_ASCIM|nr:hypothetical protein BJ508DRAFT_416581 [Ascobolus immersus RN42]
MRLEESPYLKQDPEPIATSNPFDCKNVSIIIEKQDHLPSKLALSPPPSPISRRYHLEIETISCYPSHSREKSRSRGFLDVYCLSRSSNSSQLDSLVMARIRSGAESHRPHVYLKSEVKPWP